MTTSPLSRQDPPAWLDSLNVRGRVGFNEPLKAHTWFRVGGPAEILFQPADQNDLATFLAGCPKAVPVTVLGLASNLLIRDGGIPGVTIRLGAPFARALAEGDGIIAGAATPDLNVARVAAEAGLEGFTFLSGIPGSVGGGVHMNAGAYGGEFKDIVRSVTAYTRRGERLEIPGESCGFSYRHSTLAPDLVITQARLTGKGRGDSEILKAEMESIRKKRAASQPIRERTGGSTFANPENDPEGRKAWQLIDLAGCRGLKKGGAMVSDQHCNFLINTGEATAEDLEGLGEEVRARVKEKTGLTLRWEIRRVGIPLEGGRTWP